LCRDWLLTLRPGNASWFVGASVKTDAPEKIVQRRETEARTASLIATLTRGIPPADITWRELVGHLLEFHRREAKPAWWATFARQEMSEENLIDDAECVGGLRPDPAIAPRPDKKSIIYNFTFPPQDFKLRVGDKPLRAGSLEPAGEIVALDDEAHRIALKLGPTRTRLSDVVSLIPEGPIGDRVLREAVYRYAEAVAAGNAARYAALTDILKKVAPRLCDSALGSLIITDDGDIVSGCVHALHRLTESYLLVQGPPGAGKTYTSSQAIVALLAAGRRVGVASNSHKAINNLLAAVETAARQRGVAFRGVKKSSDEQQFLEGAELIENTTSNERASSGGFNLIAGTAWLFARSDARLPLRRRGRTGQPGQCRCHGRQR
jgi:uncharacterized protein